MRLRAAMRRAGPAALLRAACVAAIAAGATGTHAPLQYDAALPAVVRVCVMVYPPFVLERVRVALRSMRVGLRTRLTAAPGSQDWYGRSFDSISYPPAFNDPASLSGARPSQAHCSLPRS